jgi:hypothetical protein
MPEYKFSSFVNWDGAQNEGQNKTSTTQKAAQQSRQPVDENMGGSAIETLRAKAKKADQNVTNIQKSRKNSRILDAVESFGDYLPFFESATERVKADRADIETDIQDIIRSREEIKRSGGYGKGGYDAAVERGLGNLQSMKGGLEAGLGIADEGSIGDILQGRARAQGAGARNQAEQEAYEKFQAADGIIGSAREIFSNFRLLTNVAVESLPSSALPMVAGAVASVGGFAVGGPKGAQTGASIGTGLGSFVTEYGNTMLETFAENGVDLDDPNSIKAALADKELMSEARWRGTRRGIAVGAFDAMSVALAGKMGGAPVARTIIGDTANAGFARKATGLLAAGAVETVGQGTLGAAGEAAGQLAADGRITSPQDIVAEFAGEIPTGVIESVGGTAVRLGADSASSTAEDDELASALRARAEANPVTQVAGQIEGPNVGEMRDLGSVRVAGMTMTPSQVLEFAQNNQSQPRIADILSQPVSDVTKVEQVARILNEQEAARVEPEAVRRISSLVGGTNPTSQSRQFITDELTKIGDEVVAASPTLSAIRDTVASERGGKQFVGTLRGIVENYSPPTQQGETFFARPERGGEGSVVMTPDQIADEAKRERDAQEAFRLAGVRQQRFDEATGTGAQREDLRAGAPDPQAQFFLNPEVYGEALGGIAATIVGAENGMVRIQYESPTETGRDGTPVIISEDVEPTAMFDRVVRGTNRMSQELAGDVRKPRRGTGTDLNPRNSVDRTSTRALVPTQEAGLPATISPTRMTGFEANTDQLPVETQNAQENPQPDRQPDVEGIVQTPPALQETAQLPAPAQAQLPAPAQQALPAPEAEPTEDTAPAETVQKPAPKKPAPKKAAKDERSKVAKHVENIEDKVLDLDRSGVVRYADRVHKEGLIDDADLAEIKRMSKDKDMGAEDIGPELISQLETKLDEKANSEEKNSQQDGNTSYSGRTDTATETEAETDTAPADIDYDAVINDRLDKIAARGGQGRIVAARLRSLLKQNNYDARQLYYAFQMGDVASRILPQNSKVDILFVPSMKASNANAAAASGIDVGSEAAGSYDAYEISQNGFRGLITLSLSDNLLGVARENAAHEAFHVIQDMLKVYDRPAYDALQKTFRDGMTIKDVDPSILRKLKTLTTNTEGTSVYDSLVNDFGDTPLSSLEAQAIAFGALVDAKDRGQSMKGLKASFIRIVDAVSGMVRGLGAILRKDGVATPAAIFEGFRSGKSQENLTEAAPLAGEVGRTEEQYSGRKSKPEYEHPKISKQKIKVPLSGTSTIPFLYNNGENAAEQTSENSMGLKDAVKAIQDRARASLQGRFGIDRITGSSPETDAYLSQAIASEAEAAVLKERATGNRSALDWYTNAIENAINEASTIYPMLADDDAAMALNNTLGFKNKEDARVIFTLALSITSQNMKVRDNARATVEQFDYFLQNGRFDPSRSYGTKAPSISGNLRLANHMLDNVFEGSAESFGAFLNTEFTVSELNGIAKRIGEKGGKDPFKISGEQASEKVYGSAIFGPKIGNGFYQNLNRNFSPVTIDLWFMRLWGRLTGTLVGNDAAIAKQAQGLRDAIAADNHPTAKVPDGYAETINDVTDDEMVSVATQMAADWERVYKSLQKQGLTSKQITDQNLKPDWAFKAVALAGQLKPNDAPTSGGQRKWIRGVVARSVEILSKNGYNVTPADLQALVWYPEKDVVNLFKEGKLEANLNVSYDTAFKELSTQRNENAETTNTNAGDGASNGNARPANRQAGVAREDGQADGPLDKGATEEEGDKVRRTLSGETRKKLIDRGTMYSGRRGTPAFDAWFGDSKIVDDNGQPLVVYHGTDQNIDSFNETVESKNNRGNIKGFFFSTSKSMAEGYGPNVVFAYLKMENPFVVGKTDIPQEMLDEYRAQLIKTNRHLDAQSDANWFDRKVADLRSNKKVSGTALNGNGSAHQATVKAGGFDGIIDGHEHAVFEPTQIKSAEENNGSFDPQDPRINYSGRRGSLRAGQGPAALRPAPSFTADNYNFGGLEPSLSDKVIFDLQDKLIDLKRIQQSITSSGRRIDDKANVYRNEELYYGRAAKRSKQFLKKELAPLIDDMKAKGVSLKMLDEFLHARHAKERNAQIAKINDQMPDGGSGLTNAQVDSYLNGLPNARRRQLENLANRVDAIIASTQKLMVEYGLETQETVDTWNKTYQSYVPLQREGFDEADGAEGSGMSVRGGSSRRALGSSLSVVDILANVAMQRERVISRGERNRIGNSLVAMALQNPNDSFWYVIDPKSADAAAAKQKLIDFGMSPPDAENVMGSPTQRYIDPKSGRVTYAPNSRFMDAKNVMATRINGEDKFVIFNARNPRAKRLVESLKGVGTVQLGRGWNALGRVTRYLSAINTQYNPAFGLYNLLRDLQGAALNLSTTPLAGKQKSVIANALPATIGMYRDLRADRGGKVSSTNWAALAEEFENEGGKTGYRDLFVSSTERADALEIELTGGSKLRQAVTKTGGPVLNWLSDFNESIENGVRLSAYKEGLDMGLSKAEAASVAKNLTVNFNRKGAVTAKAGVLYAFFNAGVQGTARLAETLAGPAGKKIVMGGLLLGVAQAIALSAAGLEDEPEWLKDKNFIIPLGGGKYVAFPMPLGFHAIPAMGRRAVEFMMSDKSVGVQTVGLLGMFADAFNPIGNAGLSAQTIAPTFTDPLVALGENRDFAGREIYREDFNKLDPTSGPSRNREGVSAVGAAISTAIDYITGGNGYTAGAISPTGDTIDYIIGQATGGVGRLALNTMSTAEAAVTGEDLPNYKIPIVGRMIGDANESAAVSKRFYEGIKEMNGHKRTVEGLEDNGKDTDSYFKQYPEADFYQDAQKYESDLSKLNKERRLLKEEGAPKSEIDAITEERQMLMNEFNQIVADYKRK